MLKLTVGTEISHSDVPLISSTYVETNIIYVFLTVNANQTRAVMAGVHRVSLADSFLHSRLSISSRRHYLPPNHTPASASARPSPLTLPTTPLYSLSLSLSPPPSSLHPPRCLLIIFWIVALCLPPTTTTTPRARVGVQAETLQQDCKLGPPPASPRSLASSWID